jgi:hypothetical protein
MPLTAFVLQPDADRICCECGDDTATAGLLWCSECLFKWPDDYPYPVVMA